MSRYELRTIQGETGTPNGSVSFSAPDVPEALVLAHKLAGSEPVELWKDDRRLCRIQRSRRHPEEPAFWMVS